MKILSPEVQQFIAANEHADEKQLVLSRKEIHGVPISLIADQIKGRKKAREKLPVFYNTPGIIYPASLNLEQSSSEQTARFKSSLIPRLLMSPIREIVQKRSLGQGVDLTGGFGVDTFFLSQHFSQFHYVESDTSLLEIARHNHQQLKANNILYHNTSAESFLEEFKGLFDLVFIDPSRRKESQRVITLSDSQPDIIALQKTILTKSEYLLVKAAPLLDISKGITELSRVKNVFIVAVENEVKELLFLCETGFNKEPLIEAVNLSERNPPVRFEFFQRDEKNLELAFSDPLSYLYEPSAAILKAGAFKTVAKEFNIEKIHPSTHLYTSDSVIQDFPGRIFKIEARVKPDPKKIVAFFPDRKANVFTRNYPLSADELKKKTELKDGGEKFLIGFSGLKEKWLVVAAKIR